MATLDTDSANRDSAIRSRAYEFWQAEGEVPGRDLDYWLRAEAEIKATPVRDTPAPAGKPARAPARKPAARARTKA